MNIIIKISRGFSEKVGYLYVTGYDVPFSSMKVTRAIKDMHNKIIECRWHEEKWDFMRERTDKSTPNHMSTAMAVCDSIKNPVTEEFLIDFIKNVENHQKMPFFYPQKITKIAKNTFFSIS
jgi:mRNA-capping enzyme